jgi:hypothetical protein
MWPKELHPKQKRDKDKVTALRDGLLWGEDRSSDYAIF